MFNIAVIGCGVVGLTSALAIQKKCKKSMNVTIFSEDFSPNTTGDVSAGLWTPYLVGNTPTEKVVQWSKATQDFLMKLWKEGKAEKFGISLQSMYLFTDNEDYTIPEWTDITMGFHKFDSEELEKFNNKYKKNIKHGFSFVTFIWEPSIFLPQLQEIFVNNGGRIIQRKIHDFEELSDFDLVVNCTGLGAKYVTNDQSMFPIRGQIMRVSASWQYHVMMLDLGEGNYIIPNKDSIILGGTHQEGDYNCQVSENDRLHIINGCSAFVPALKTAKVIKHFVGLRPARDQVRLNVEHRITTQRKSQYVIHNYGHGGSGVTLSIGCANDAAELTGTALNLLRCRM